MGKKKMKKKNAKSKKAAPNKRTAAKKTVGKKTAKRKASRTKSLISKKSATKTRASPKKTPSIKTAGTRDRAPRTSRISDADALEVQQRRSGSAGQSGDLQGLSEVEGADSESVDELLEEGNAFEADVVSGVERARDSEGSEVHTREVPEDDVPSEYLDEE
jgi:hypothetical protein